MLLAATLCRSSVIGTNAASAPEVRTFQAVDGALLAADVYVAPLGTKAPTVILMHMLGKDRQSFSPLINPLLAAGFSVINVDLRGHGQSVSTRAHQHLNFILFTQADWAKLPGDALAVMHGAPYIKGISGENVAIIGSSIGANAAAMVIGDARIKAEVLLSPGYDYHGLQPQRYIQGAQKPILVIYGKGDPQSAESIAKWGAAGAKYKVIAMDTPAHGNFLLTQKPDSIKEIVTFLTANLKP
jgi:alpha-beta hydrolase superfamily lysophospholipase